MLCRRCGMESSTTDVCEWCRRPMLPPGASITSREGPGGAAQPAQAGPAEAPPLAPEPELEQVEERPAAGSASADAEQVLRPLGSELPTASGHAGPRPGVPSHGLSQDATRTSIDVSQYVGQGESLFRPLRRSEASMSLPGGGDPLAQRKVRRSGKSQTVSEIPENTRLLRSLLAGLVISLAISLIQFLVTGQSGQQLYILQVGQADDLATALKYGVLLGVLLGFLLGAVLTRFRRGPFLGMLVGLVLGWGLQNPPWALIAGGLTGIVAGRLATVGLRQIISV